MSYTDTDVELVTAATERHHIDFERTDADGHNPCVCGGWWDSAEMPGWDQHMAEVALRALAAAGRLTPADAETRTEYNLRFRKPNDQWCVDEALTSTKPEDDWAHTRRLFGADVHQVSRTVTEYPDGSYLVGPWLPVPAEPAPLADRLGDTWASPVTVTGFDTEEDR